MSNISYVVSNIPIDSIDSNPYQIQSSFDNLKIESLVESVRKYGLKQIPVARKVNNRYQLAFGHQRLLAFKVLKNKFGYEHMPLKIEVLDDKQMFDLFVIENMNRKDLSPIDKALILQRHAKEFNATSEESAKLFGISSSHVRGLIRLLNLPDDLQNKVRNGEMSYMQARRILSGKKEFHYEKASKETHTGNLKLKLIKLVYGKYRPDITDNMLFHEIRKVFELKRSGEVSDTQIREK